MYFSFFLTYCHLEKYKNFSIENNISQPPDKLKPEQKLKIIKHVRFRETY